MRMTICLITILILGLSISGQTTLPQPVATPTNVKTVIAKMGETVESVAKRNGADPVETAKFNGLLPNTVLAAGRKISIPSPVNPLSRISTEILPIGCSYVMDVGTEGSNGYKLYFQWATRRKDYDTAEIWTCMTPLDRPAYLKKSKLPKTYAYSLQFISIDCERSRYTADRLMPYDTKRMPIISRSSLWTSVYWDPIVPGSIGQSIKQKLCFK